MKIVPLTSDFSIVFHPHKSDLETLVVMRYKMMITNRPQKESQEQYLSSEQVSAVADYGIVYQYITVVLGNILKFFTPWKANKR